MNKLNAPPGRFAPRISIPSRERVMGLRAVLPPTMAGLVAFVCGLTEIHVVNVLGQVYVYELLLPLAALAALISGKTSGMWRSGMFWMVMAGLVGLFVGYVLSDIIRDTPQVQYLRGWGRIGLLATTFFFVCVLTTADKRNLWWLALGIAVGGTLYLRLVLHLPLANWKFDYSQPITLGFAAAAVFLPMRVAAVGFAVLGVLSMQWDFRSHSAFCMAIAAIVWLRAANPLEPMKGIGNLVRLGAAGAIALVAVNIALEWTEDDWHKQRRETSSVGRFLMLGVGAEIIAGSPIIGYGSWGQHAEIAEVERRTFQESENPNVRAYPISGSVMAVHSQLLQAWLEGGILAGLFFLAYFVLVANATWYIVTARPWDLLSPILLTFCTNALWHWLMSPFAAPHRISIAMACVAVVLVSIERASARRPAVTGPLKTLVASAVPQARQLNVRRIKGSRQS